MKHFAKKALCVLLSLTVLFTALAVSLSTYASENATGTDIPLIYVSGQGGAIVRDNPDGSRERIYPIQIPEGYIQNAVKENLGVFALAVATQKWDDFCDVLYEKMTPLYTDIKLGKDGKPTDGSHVDWTWSRDTILNYKPNGKYPTEQYQFYYDWRLDPYEIADTLHAYIEDVLAVTGEKEVALLGRCLGACITTAYMEKYDGEYVSDHILYASALNGAEFCSKAFCGELYLDSDGVERFVYDINLSDDSNINELIKAFVTVFNDTYGLDIAMWSINNVYPNIYLDIVPRILRETYGTFPGYWSMVGKEDYEKAKETVFYGANLDEYETFINKIDNYHYNVQLKAPEFFADFADKGVNIANVTKYGYQTVPVVKDADVISEDVCNVADASMGATTTTLDTVFDDEYLANAQVNGTDRYISPDKQIDASTCLFPNNTWFIKNLKHKVFPECINRLFDRIINVDDFNVFNDEDYPQYLIYNDESDTLTPMVEYNMNTTDKYFVSFFDALKKLFECVFVLIRDAIAQNNA